MPIINIRELDGYDAASIHELLLLEETNKFEVHYPIHEVAEKVPNHDVGYAYYMAAWAGQVLSDISFSFSYFIPSEIEIMTFIFNIETSDLKKLAEIIFVIIDNTFNGNEIDEQFEVNGRKFYDGAFDFGAPVATYGLLSLAMKYLEYEV